MQCNLSQNDLKMHVKQNRKLQDEMCAPEKYEEG